MASDLAEFGPVRTLRRVVPIARTVIRGGLALTLVVLEDYAEGFLIRCWLIPQAGHPVRDLMAARSEAGQARLRALFAEPHVRSRPVAPMMVQSGPPPDEPKALSPIPVWTARDDCGTSYRRLGFGGGANATGEFTLESTFAPALAAEARALRIEVAEIGWTELPPLARDERPRVRVDPGPWMFSVDLSAGIDLMVSV